MSKFKIGDKVVPSPEYEGAVSTHPWLVDGAIYTITSVISSGDWVNIEGVFTKQANPHTKGTDWSVDWFELYEEKETEMTAEQIRNEIIRINSRIEEANKDIEKAQEERNSLVEKLREKGFELTRNEDSSEDVEQNNLVGTGDTVRIVKYNPEFHDCDCTGVLAEVLSTDESDRPYYVETDNGV